MKLKHLEAALLDCGFDIDEDTVAMRALAAARRDVEETLAPREASPELVEAEKWLRSANRLQYLDCDGAEERSVIAAELARLRAALVEAEQRGRRQAFEESRREFVKAGPGKFSDWLEVQRDACTPANRDEGESNGQG